MTKPKSSLNIILFFTFGKPAVGPFILVVTFVIMTLLVSLSINETISLPPTMKNMMMMTIIIAIKKVEFR